MNVALIDVDSKMANACLMKLSTIHKNKGDNVTLGWSEGQPCDLAYVSKVFDWSEEPALPDCEIIKGGTGYPVGQRNTIFIEDFDKTMPDYSLYPECDFAIGRFTRGCPNSCPWCVVPGMDGHEIRWVADLKDFWNGQKVVRVLDDNIMANEDMFVEACRQLHDADVKVLWEALDIRLVNERIAEALASVKIKGQIHFAWDGHSQDAYIERGIEMLERAGIKRYKLMFYVLVGAGTKQEYDLHRIYTLRDLGVDPYVARIDGSDPYQKDISRWVNNKTLFKSIRTFEEYPKPKYRKKFKR